MRIRTWLALTCLMATVPGCPAPLPPVHGMASIGASRQVPRLAGAPPPDVDERSSELVYTLRAGLNPLGYTSAYDYDPTFDLGLGYAFEHFPITDTSPWTHGPYAEISAWPSFKPYIGARIGVRGFAEFLMMEIDRDKHGGIRGNRRTGFGGTLAFAWEATGSTDAGVWKRERRPSALGYGRGAWGIMVGPSYRNLDGNPYWILGVGLTGRLPVSVGDLATDYP